MMSTSESMMNLGESMRIKYIYGLSIAVLFCSTLLILCATVERFLVIARIRRFGLHHIYSQRGRKVAVGGRDDSEECAFLKICISRALSW